MGFELGWTWSGLDLRDLGTGPNNTNTPMLLIFTYLLNEDDCNDTFQNNQVSSMKVARTEHTLSLVYGLPTIVGGVNGDQFIASVEQFDKSSNRWTHWHNMTQSGILI